MNDESGKVFDLERFRVEFTRRMERINRRMSELDRLGSELHLRVARFCAS